MTSGEEGNDRLVNGDYRTVLQNDGNLVTYDKDDHSTWSS